ncbi:MAG: hypothetical protein IMZ67_05940 [Acidobacteria bacterium]|nr:hypothetical protein [Acidobacteriota bacterium]
MTTEDAICYHEAGHCVIGIALGFEVDSVWMYHDPPGNPVCFFTHKPGTKGPEVETIVTLAGEAAERRGARQERKAALFRNPALAEWLPPEQAYYAWARDRAREYSAKDYAKVEQRYDPEDVVGHARILLAQIKAEELVEQHWEIIRLVAFQLLNNPYGALAGADVMDTVKRRL